MTRELKDIEVKEVSLVDKAANKKKKYLFFKQEGKSTKATNKKLKKKINIVIDSDGTIGGTKIAVNKDELKNLRDFNFSFWSREMDDLRAVSCSYSKFVETEDGFSRSETFYLSKGDAEMDEKIQKQLEEYFGEEKVDFEKAEESDVITKSLETVNEYQEEFPDDLKKAVGVIAKQAGFCDTIISKILEKKQAGKTGVEKVGAKFSKETLSKLNDLVAAIKALEEVLPKEGTEKSDKGSDEESELKKTITELTKSIEKLEDKKDDKAKDELTKTLAELTKRLEVIEKGTGVKKGIEGQDDDDDSDGEKKWPSFSGKKKQGD